MPPAVNVAKEASARVHEEQVAAESLRKEKTTWNYSEKTNTNSPTEYPLRTWTDVTGKYKVEARFHGFSNGKVKLTTSASDDKLLSLEQLSQEDQEWIEANKMPDSI